MFGRHRGDPQATQTLADGRLRFVLLRSAGANFTIDAIVHDEGTGRLGPVGTMVTLRLHRPSSPRDDVVVENLLRQWADDDRIVDVTLGEDATVTALEAEGTSMRLHLIA